jgi:hypothetical protein
MGDTVEKTQDSGFLTTLAEKASDHGDFAFGMFLAAAINYFFFRLATGEQRKHIKLIQEREKYLDQQLEIREDRINKLHDMLRKGHD